MTRLKVFFGLLGLIVLLIGIVIGLAELSLLIERKFGSPSGVVTVFGTLIIAVCAHAAYTVPINKGK